MEEICDKYKNGIGLEALCKEYHLGKLKIKAILLEHGVEIRKKGGQTQKHDYKVSDWKVEKYPLEEGYYYEAHSKDGKYITKDYMNQGGFLTSYIKNTYNVTVPSLYDRREYYKTTGNYWWEQWFDIIKIHTQDTKKCPYCDWETIDVENKSGVFEQHLKDVHGKNVEEYLKDFPNDASYFKVYLKKKEKCDKLNDEYNFVICPICGKKYPKITSSHLLNMHDMTMKEFKAKYKDVTIMSNAAIDQIKYEQRFSNLHVSKNRFISKYERELQEWLTSKNIEFETNRQILFGKEIDILIPSLHIGIEFDGLKWHTEDFGKKDRNYHVDKTNKCNEHGYGLIHIFEDEYVNHKDLVYHKLSHLLHLDNDLPKISGRKLEVKEILMHEAKEFLNKFHIQGFVSSTVYLGGFFNGQLVAVMALKHGNVKNPNWELTRFASDYHYKFQGVGGKMFKYFMNEYNPYIVVSFADRRWTLGSDINLYTRLGFELKEIGKPDYRYYNADVDRYKRVHKMAFNKQALHRKFGFPLEMTEREMTKELGYDRIWDCGLYKYVWERD